MPIEVGIWRIGNKLEPVGFSSIDSENRLEDLLVDDLAALFPDLMLIGRQIQTDFGKFLDLLAMDIEGNLIIIELKKDRTPRDVIAQVLDYGAWVQNLSFDDVASIYADKNDGRSLEEGFARAFGNEESDGSGINLPDELNQNQQMIVVASELDLQSERIVNFLTDNFGVPINVVFFRHFQDGKNEYLTRTWLLDPVEAEKKSGTAKQKKKKEPWNGRDFYVALGEGETRTWKDCVEYGFVAAGQGEAYSRPLQNLFPGARVNVLIPKAGYVGVGTVLERAVPVKDFTVKQKGREIPILEAPINSNLGKNSDDEKLSEYLVRVEWEKTLPKDQAYWETGLFANQNVVCKLIKRHTLEKLRKRFDLDD